MNLNKRNIVLQAAVASALLTAAIGAQAGNTTATGITFAKEIFGAAATTLTNAGTNMNVGYALGVGRTTTAGTFQTTVTLSNATFAQAVTSAAIVSGSCVVTAALRSGGAVGDSTVVLDVTPTADCTATQTFSFTMPSVKGTTAMATAGSKITASVDLKDLFGALDTSGTHATTIATSASSLTATATASVAGAAPLLNTIDAISQASKFFLNGGATGAKITNLGTLVYANVAGSKQADGATDRVKLVGDAIAATLTGDFTASLALASSSGVTLQSAAACDKTGVVINASTLSSTQATFAAVPGTTTATNICVTVDGTTPMVASAYSLTASYTPAATTETVTSTPATAMMTTKLNVVQVDLRNYVPASAMANGFTQYVRIINTGSPAAEIRGAWIDPVTGVVGASFQLIPSLAAGAATDLRADAIEAKMGAVATKQRLRITGATSSLSVQNFLFMPSGNFGTVHGAD